MISSRPIPDHAQIVIIGGGVIGASVAYHLAQFGRRDVVIVEKSSLTDGCTWHAAGLVGQLRGKLGLTRMMQNSTALYSELEQATGYAPGWKPVGSLRLASSPNRWMEIKQMAVKARAFGIELHLLDEREAADLFPLIERKNIVGAAFIPDDGYIDPYGLTQALAAGARSKGVRICEQTEVTGFTISNGRIDGVKTDQGEIKCETVVNCAGLWSRRIGELAGVSIPAGIVEHQYLITEKSDRISDDLPTLRDPDHNFYLKVEAGSFEFGGWENDSVAVDSGSFPFDFVRTLYNSNFDRFDQIYKLTAKRLPVIEKLGVQTLINGPIPVSPDGEPILGLAGELKNFYVACGFTAGIAASGGAGRAIAEWIIDGRPSFDLWSFDIRRFGPFHAQSPYLEERALQSYGRYYKIHWPQEELQAGRMIRCSPLYEILKEKGAVFGAKFGWERPNWFAPEGTKRIDIPSFHRPNWFNAVAFECRAIRSRVALIDQTSYAKFEITGTDALPALNSLTVCNVDRPYGTVIYAQCCNESGGIECDVVILRISRNQFCLVTGSGFGIHDLDWITRNISDYHDVSIRDISDQFVVINLCGPLSRDVLRKVTENNVSNEAFPYLTFQSIQIGDASVRAVRIGYTGELGWELYMDRNAAYDIYRKLWNAGLEFDIANAGYRSLDSLRLENGYLYWSGEISPYINPYEAGLDFRVNFKKNKFIGKELLEAIRDKGVSRKLYAFTHSGYIPLYGSEPLLSDGKVIGSTLSGGYGHTLEQSICYAFVPVEFDSTENFSVQTPDKIVSVERHTLPLYDPGRKRVRS